ncbi:MAG: DUF2282 domain-containing protein [Bauldia sp.]
MTNTLSTATLVGAFAMALGSFAVTPAAADMAAAKAKTEMKMGTGKFEPCYGVAMKGQNDCAEGAHSCAGLSTADYDPASFKLVPTGTCTTMKTPNGMGMLKAM